MGIENTKCCCKSKETNEMKMGTEKGEIIEIDSAVSPRLNKDFSMKDLKSYITFKNNSSQKEDISNGNNINENKDEYQRKPSILLNSKKNNLQKENKDSDLPPLPKKRYGYKNSNIKRVSFEFDSMKNNIGKNKNNNSNSYNNSISNINSNTFYYNKIQSIYKGYYFRNKIYPKLKKELEENLMNQLKEIYEKYLTNNLKTQEEKLGIIHDENSYKSLLKIENKSEKNLYTKLLKLKYNNKNAFYVGEISINNTLNGYGILTLENGEKLKGKFENNKFESGILIDEEGNYFEGNFNINNKIEGNGKKISLNNSIYIGDFINGLKEGKGNEETKEHIYEGNFKNDKKNGYGKLYYKELKDHYEGNFLDNQITGIGKYFWSNGEIYEGKLINGKMNGKGIYIWPDGGKYEGDYIDNTKEGFGIFKWPNGKIYEGPFVNGKPNGDGILITKKKKFKVKFVNGVINKDVKEFSDLDKKKYKDDDSLSSISFVSGYNKEKVVEENKENLLSKKNHKNKKRESFFKKKNTHKKFSINSIVDNGNENNDSFIKNNNVKNENKVKKKRIVTEKDIDNFDK